MNILFRKASSDDWEEIAKIHISSWQENYRGIFTDRFLDHDIYEDRNSVWKDRFINPSFNQYIIVAEHDENMIGFACMYCHHKGERIHYLDNLHVKSNFRGNGIGEDLLYKSALYAFKEDPLCPFYLLVFEENEKAIRFYMRMGAIISAPFRHENQDGTISQVVRCTWPSLAAFKK